MDEDGENSELDPLRVLSAAPLPPLPVLSSASPSAARSSLSSVCQNIKNGGQLQLYYSSAN